MGTSFLLFLAVVAVIGLAIAKQMTCVPHQGDRCREACDCGWAGQCLLVVIATLAGLAAFLELSAGNLFTGRNLLHAAGLALATMLALLVLMEIPVVIARLHHRHLLHSAGAPAGRSRHRLR